jgi:hypothetical protein
MKILSFRFVPSPALILALVVRFRGMNEESPSGYAADGDRKTEKAVASYENAQSGFSCDQALDCSAIRVMLPSAHSRLFNQSGQ